MPRVRNILLTAGYGPNELGWGEDMYDMMNSRLARGHSPFRMDSHCHYFGLYLIAENLNLPVTVLENMHWEEFDAELDRDYDVIGIQLKSVYTDKVARMVARIREKCPDTEIVIGGYGVSTLDKPVPGDTKGSARFIRENAHHFCREEGVRFMRRLLDDEPVDREITQFHMPTTGLSLAGLNSVQLRVPIILVALGCPNACDFCNTSAFFHHKKIYVADPEQVYRFIRNYQKRLSSRDILINFFDEDIFQDPEFVRALGRLLRSDRQTWGVRWFAFGSMDSLSRFTVEELRECGLGTVWIGVESFSTEAGTTEDSYAKRKGRDLNKMFKELHGMGIQTTGSLVLGFDFHTPENLKKDIDMFVDMKPTFYQIAPLTPCPGTRLYDRMMEEGRIRDSYSWSDFHIWKDDVFEMKNFGRNEIKEYYDYAHEQLAVRNGPPQLQMMECVLDAFARLKNSRSEFLRYQAEQDRRLASIYYPYLDACKRYGSSKRVRERAALLERRYRSEIGSPPLLSRLVSRHVSRRIKRDRSRAMPAVLSDPLPRWTYYRRENGSLRVLVRKGRKPGKPVLYRDHRFVSLNTMGIRVGLF